MITIDEVLMSEPPEDAASAMEYWRVMAEWYRDRFEALSVACRGYEYRISLLDAEIEDLKASPRRGE